MGKYNLEKAHTLTNGHVTPYTTWDNSDLKTKRQKGDFFSLFNEIDGIEARSSFCSIWNTRSYITCIGRC